MPTRSALRNAAAAMAASLASPLFAAAPDGQLVTFNNNGIWCWYQDDRVLVDQATGQLLVTSIASGDGIGGAARDSRVEIVSYNLTTNAVTAPTTLIDWKTTLGIIADDHNVPALTIRPDGRYVATYTAHQNDSVIRTRVSTNPGDATSWGTENRLTVTSNQGTTYSNVYKLSSTGVTYDFYRGNNYDPHVLTSTDDGSTYAYKGHLLMDPANGSGARPYLRYASNGTDKIFFSTSTGHPRDSNTGVFVGYLGANNRLYNLNGVDLGGLGTNTGTAVSATSFTPVLPANTVVNGTTRTHGWTTDIQLDSAGNPYMGFTSRVAGSTADHRFYYSRWTGSTLVTNEVARAGNYLYAAEPDYTGLMALSPGDPNTLYVSTKIDPRDGTGSTTTAKYEIYRGFTTDTGATWQWVPITVGSTDDNLRPTLPSWDDTHSALVWMKGTYTTYQHANMAMVGKFYTGHNGRWTNANGGTWTTAGNWTDGRQADGMSFIADFGTIDVVGDRTVDLAGASRTLGFLTFGDTNTATAGGWTLTNGAIRLDGGVVAPTITVKAGSATLALPVFGSQGLTKVGPGTLTLSGSNTYAGDTNVYAGTLSVASIADNTGTGNTINLGSGAGTGTLVYTGAGEVTGKSIYLSTGAAVNGGTIDMSGTDTLRFTAATLAAHASQPHTLTLQGSTAGLGQIDGVISNGSATNKTSLVKRGSGQWALTGNNTYTGPTVIEAGTLQVSYRSSGSSAASPLLVSAGGVDIQAGNAVFDYAGDTSPATLIRGLLATSFSAGSGVMTAGQIRSTTATVAKGLGYLDDGTSVRVAVALFGDLDLDGGVSINDFSALAGNFGRTDKFWADGDVNYDGNVSIDDFNLLSGNFGQTLPAARDWAPLIAFAAAHDDLVAFEAITGVPEPSLTCVVAAATAVGLRRRSRRI